MNAASIYYYVSDSGFDELYKHDCRNANCPRGCAIQRNEVSFGDVQGAWQRQPYADINALIVPNDTAVALAPLPGKSGASMTIAAPEAVTDKV